MCVYEYVYIMHIYICVMYIDVYLCVCNKTTHIYIYIYMCICFSLPKACEKWSPSYAMLVVDKSLSVSQLIAHRIHGTDIFTYMDG